MADDTGGRDEIKDLRDQVADVNQRLLALLSDRARLVLAIHQVKRQRALDPFDPDREQQMLDALVDRNAGPFGDDVVRHLFKEIFKASLDLMEGGSRRPAVARRPGDAEVVVRTGTRCIGPTPVVIAGPCAIEDEAQMEQAAATMARLGVGFLRGGAFKPRTSPYAFQGLGETGLRWLAEAAARHGLTTVTEVVDTRTVDLVARYADVLQVGSRNMANYELLKAVAGAGKPVLLKRGFAATLDEFIQAAEYVASSGNESIILCERGIRTFNRETRFTLDIAAVPLLLQETRLPVIVDVSHAAGRRDLLVPLARAGLAAGARGVMVEVHPHPAVARSDGQQQLDFVQFEGFLAAIADLLTSR